MAIASRSRCSRAWRHLRRGPCAMRRAACCSMRRSSPSQIARHRSHISHGASTRTPRRRTSCAPCSTSRRGRPHGTNRLRCSAMLRVVGTRYRPRQRGFRTEVDSSLRVQATAASRTAATPTSRSPQTGHGRRRSSSARRFPCRRSSPRQRQSTISWPAHCERRPSGPTRVGPSDAACSLPWPMRWRPPAVKALPSWLGRRARQFARATRRYPRRSTSPPTRRT